MKSPELKAYGNDFENALNAQDNVALANAMNNRFKDIETNILNKFEELKDEHDEEVLKSRGVRTLTNEETKFYNSLFKNEVGLSPTVGGSKIMPKTIFDQVFEDLRSIKDDNPLALIDMINATGATEWLVSIAESPVATWGEMCEGVTKELSVGFRVTDTITNKLSCYIPYCKSLIDLGPVWQDAYVREYLMLGLRDGLVKAVISGTGEKQPWGMAYDYDASKDTGTIKTAVEIKKIDKANFAPIFKTLTTNPTMNRHRALENPTLFVDSETYYSYVYANDAFINSTGDYVSVLDKMGVKVCMCETGLTKGQAIIALPKRYFLEVCMKAGADKGMVEFSDDYMFLEDKRIYKAKLFAEGFLKDKNGAVLLDLTKIGTTTTAGGGSDTGGDVGGDTPTI